MKNKRDGFSLVEVALALLIIGIIVGPMMQQYSAWKNSQFVDVTKNNGTLIEDALTKYVENFGCYPVPAAPGVNSGTAAAGVEGIARVTCTPLTAGQLAGIPNCGGSDAVLCKEAAAAGVAGAGPVLVGDVPYNTLGLPKTYILDGYRRKFTYAVSANQVLDSTSLTFDDTKGAVKVVDLAGAGPPQGAGPAVLNAHYAIVSHGKDGAGAFTLDNGATPVAACAALGKDGENCRYNDGTFDDGYAAYRDTNGTQQYARQESRIAGASHFDDFVYYRTTISTDIWRKDAATADIMNNTDPGNVLVKMPTTSGPANPQGKLDVRGDLSADAVWTNIICDTSSNTFVAGAYSDKPCSTAGGFSPLALAATPPKAQVAGDNAIHCNMVNTNTSVPPSSQVGVPMTGIASADEVCADYTNAAQVPIQNTYNVPGCLIAGTYPFAVDAFGGILCKLP